MNLDCPNCESSMIKSYGEEAKFRLKLIRWDKSGMYAVCKSCGHDVGITPELLKQVQSSFVFEVEEKDEPSPALR